LEQKLTKEKTTNSVARRTWLIRIGIWLFLCFAACAAVSLVVEWYHFTQSMPDRGWNLQVARLVGLVMLNLVFTALIASIVVLLLWVRLAGALPTLQGWHLQIPESEFCAVDATPDYKIKDYLEQENRVFNELSALICGPWAQQCSGAFSRYNANSICNPEKVVDRNWNRTTILEASHPIGGVLLLHGLSDSPYSLRAIGQRLHAEGHTVIWLRLPGHGTNPGALAHASSDDWIAAVKVAMRGLRDLLPENAPITLGGYSNGGALSVLYTLSAIYDKSLPKPKAIVLFAPMIGINPMASMTRLYHTVAVVSRNQKAQWSAINAEIDPFRYSSWPMNASVQAWYVTQTVEKQLSQLQKSGRMNEMPPILAMQSVVDSTIVVPKLITVLFDRLTTTTNELVLFDINRMDKLSNLFNRSFEEAIYSKLERTDLPYALSILKNENSESAQIVFQTRDGKSSREILTDMTWPDGVVSLSHLAVPIPPDDPIYGTKEATVASGLSLGTLSVRAEPNALLISDSLFFRCRNNPFYDFMEDHIVKWLSDRAG
jgi:alpha-beta hydrolase superfamily lysophospholipase